MAIALSFMAPLMASLAASAARRTVERHARLVERRWAGPLRTSPAHSAHTAHGGHHAPHAAHVARVVRVVRVVDEAQATPTSGRMVISGRLADVCAELDRLAAREA